MESAKPNPPLFWGTLITVVVVDLVTKLIAAATLSPQHIPHEILGNHLRLTLVYNPGAAFGLNLGVYSRWIFMALTAGALPAGGVAASALCARSVPEALATSTAAAAPSTVVPIAARQAAARRPPLS